MITKCCLCGEVYGSKEPFEDLRVSHGYCPACYLVELEKFKEKVKKREEKESANDTPWRKIYVCLY